MHLCKGKDSAIGLMAERLEKALSGDWEEIELRRSGGEKNQKSVEKGSWGNKNR